jgi:Secretion system C-terminal sorting domain
MKKTLLFILLITSLFTVYSQNSGPIICIKDYCTDEGIEDVLVSQDIGLAMPSLSSFSQFTPAIGCTLSGITPLIPDTTLAIRIKGEIDPLNGISTYDLVLIASHINGTQPFTCPYQWIAADVNNDQLVDSADLVDLRSLLLGIYTVLPNSSYLKVFPVDFPIDPANPLANPLPTQPFIFPTNNIPTNIAYYGVRTGRVGINCDCLNSSTSSLQKTDQIIVAPNPTQDWVTIEYLGALNTDNYVIYDIMGKAVTQGVLAGQTTKISLANCPNGIYTLCVHSEKGIYKTMKINKI